MNAIKERRNFSVSSLLNCKRRSTPSPWRSLTIGALAAAPISAALHLVALERLASGQSLRALLWPRSRAGRRRADRLFAPRWSSCSPRTTNRRVLAQSGEFARWDCVSAETPDDEDALYPSPPFGAEELQRLARSAAQLTRRLPRNDGPKRHGGRLIRAGEGLLSSTWLSSPQPAVVRLSRYVCQTQSTEGRTPPALHLAASEGGRGGAWPRPSNAGAGVNPRLYRRPNGGLTYTLVLLRASGVRAMERAGVKVKLL